MNEWPMDDASASDASTNDVSGSDHPFAKLNQDMVIDAVEATGRLSDLRVFPLNSYENRVYQVGIEDGAPIIAKFYRPERWSDAQIAEEHTFSRQLAAADVPVVPPLVDANGNTVHEHAGFRFALYERKGGHAPALDDMDSLYQLGQLLGRIHLVGSIEDFAERPALTPQNFGHESVEMVLKWMPKDLIPAYESLARDLLERIDQRFASVEFTALRVHGDCHVGNILVRDERIHFVDLDDSRRAPAIQDLWMFLTGERYEQQAALSELIDGYNEFYDFNPRELALVESLRTLRIMHHAAWLASRWSDPAFPMAFVWFNTERYWAGHILELREQLALIDEPPLTLN